MSGCNEWNADCRFMQLMEHKLNNANAELDRLQEELRRTRAWVRFWYGAALSAESSVALAFKKDYD